MHSSWVTALAAAAAARFPSESSNKRNNRGRSSSLSPALLCSRVALVALFTPPLSIQHSGCGRVTASGSKVKGQKFKQQEAAFFPHAHSDERMFLHRRRLRMEVERLLLRRQLNCYCKYCCEIYVQCLQVTITNNFGPRYLVQCCFFTR